MFASLKSKIREETGSDIGKITSSWRAGSFLGRITQKDDSTSSTTPTSGPGDSTSESISPQLESYLSDRTGGQIDQPTLQEQYTNQLEEKLKERDAYWERKMEDLKLSLATDQKSEAAAAQGVARAAAAAAAEAAAERDHARELLLQLRERTAHAEHAQDRLDQLVEELEQSRREWSRERAVLQAAASTAETRAADLADELAVARAALEGEGSTESDEPPTREAYDRISREKAVLQRQLQEAKMALADVKTSWSGQIASLETQVARLSRQAGEEGAERRRIENDKKELQQKLTDLSAELEKTKQSLANSDAKVVRLNGEVHSLAMEVKSLRSSADHVAEKMKELERKLQSTQEENEELRIALENERSLVRILKEKIEKSTRLYDERGAELVKTGGLVFELQRDLDRMQRNVDKEKCEKDEAFLRNAQISQQLQLSQCEVRYQADENVELRSKLAELETLLAQHKENQAECMMIKEAEETRKKEMEELNSRIQQLQESETSLKKSIQDFETEICDKNKKIKTLESRIADMKKTLQRELQSSKSDLTSAEEQDISRRYLKHVVLRFLTSRELEARQLTRALSTLLRLTAHEEALLRTTLSSRSGLTNWFPSLGNT